MNPNVQLYQELLSALQRSEDVILVSLISSRGSTPAGTGAQLFLSLTKQEGTVGGGRLEAVCLEAARRMLQKGEAVQKLDYQLRPNAKKDIGMVCGGDASLLLQRLSPRSLPLIQALLERLRRAESCYLLLAPKADGLALLSATGERLLSSEVHQNDGEHEEVATALALLFAQGRPRQQMQLGEWTLFPFFSTGRLYLFGGGHVALALSKVLRELDFATVLYEDRADFATLERFPHFQERICAPYADVLQHLQLQEEDQVCILTRGHASDYEVLKAVLGTPVGYIGLMGSKRKIYQTRERLQAEGLSLQGEKRLHAPIGLAIGASSPAEIAISIAAELIADRHQRVLSKGQERVKASCPELR